VQVGLPVGFSAHTARVGLRAPGAGASATNDDLSVVLAPDGTSCAAVFTQSSFAGPSVTLSRDHCRAGGVRAAVIIAGNANVANGPRGLHDAEEVCQLVASRLSVQPSQLLLASTGVIGRPYPMERLRPALATLPRPPEGGFEAGPAEVAAAMMTTDTKPKVASRSLGHAVVVGVAKGVGMVEPNMATMLALVMTDAAVDPAALDGLWRATVEGTFNCLSVDGDTSTSDTAAIFASGLAGPVPLGDLSVAVREVCLDLTLQLARDGEGATKLMSVNVVDAADPAQAKRVAKAIVNSPLVKTAVHGADPNWGRVAMAVGKSTSVGEIDPDRVTIRFGDLEAYPARPGPEGLEELRRLMSADHVDIEVSLGTGEHSATVFGCDLSAEYVRINADYTT